MCRTWLPPSSQAHGSLNPRCPRVLLDEQPPYLALLSATLMISVFCPPLSPPPLPSPLLPLPFSLWPRLLGSPRPLGVPRPLGAPCPPLSPACSGRANLPRRPSPPADGLFVSQPASKATRAAPHPPMPLARNPSAPPSLGLFPLTLGPTSSACSCFSRRLGVPAAVHQLLAISLAHIPCSRRLGLLIPRFPLTRHARRFPRISAAAYPSS